MNTKFYWTCPLCATNQIAWADIEGGNKTTRKIVFCDNEQGGCDQPVVLFLTVSVNVSVYKLVEANLP